MSSFGPFLRGLNSSSRSTSRTAKSLMKGMKRERNGGGGREGRRRDGGRGAVGLQGKFTYLANWKTSNTNFSILMPLGLLGSTLQERAAVAH